MPKHLILRLKAPIASFGAVSGEELRRAGEAPTRSMVLGLIGNAMGLDRTRSADMVRLDRLQARTRFAALTLSDPGVWSDVQNARVGAARFHDTADRLVRGGRITDDPAHLLAGNRALADDRLSKFLLAKPVQRRKDYLTGVHALVALSPVGDWPEAPEALADALRRPARALSIGRKACPPAAPVAPLAPLVDATDGVAALAASLQEAPERDAVAAWARPFVLWWEGDPEPGSAAAAELGVEGGFATEVLDRKDWVRRLHTGGSTLWRGTLAPPGGGARAA